MNTIFVDNPVNEGSPYGRDAMHTHIVNLLRTAILVFVAAAFFVLALDSTIRGTVVVTTMYVIAYICATALIWVISRREKYPLMPAVAMTVTASMWAVLVALDVSSVIFSGAPTTLIDHRRWTHTLVETILMCLPLTFVAIVAPSSSKCNDDDGDSDSKG